MRDSQEPREIPIPLQDHIRDGGLAVLAVRAFEEDLSALLDGPQGSVDLARAATGQGIEPRIGLPPFHGCNDLLVGHDHHLGGSMLAPLNQAYKPKTPILPVNSGLRTSPSFVLL